MNIESAEIENIKFFMVGMDKQLKELQKKLDILIDKGESGKAELGHSSE